MININIQLEAKREIINIANELWDALYYPTDCIYCTLEHGI